MKNIYSITALMLLVSFTNEAQPLTDIRIVQEDQRSVVLEFTPHIRTEHVIGTRGGIFTRFRFYESQTTFDSSGQADFTRNILLLFPSTRYSFQVLGSEFQIRDSIKLLPKPTIKSLKDFGISEIYNDAKFVQDARSSTSRALAEVVKVGKTSLGYIGTVRLRPIHVIDKERVRVYSRITVRLEFNDALPNGMQSSCFLMGKIPQKAQLSKAIQTKLQKIALGNYPFEQGDWYRMDITDDGMYKLDFNYLRNLNISIHDINVIRIYGNGGLVIPDNNTDPRPDSLVEIPRLVVRKNSNGVDTADYIIFYGRGVTGWKYYGSNSFRHYINPYTIKNCYFFTVSQDTGKPMVSIYSPNPASTSLSYFLEKKFTEQELTNLLRTGRRWFGQEFTQTDNIHTYINSLPGIVANSNINYLFNFVRRSASEDILNIFESGNSILQMSMGPSEMGDGETDPYADDLPVNATGGVPQNESDLKIQITSTNVSTDTWLDWLEIYYQRKFEALNDALMFTTPDSSGPIQYSVHKLSSEIRAFDITDHQNVMQILNLVQSGDSCTFQLSQMSGNIREVAVVDRYGYKTPPAAIKIDKYVLNNNPQENNLHDFQDQIDFIIISPADFISEANRLKDYRQLHDSLNTLVVDIQQIFNEFSGGIPDPLAIREFLTYTQNKWSNPVPHYVMLFGDGYYDYKNIISTQRNWIPPFETAYSFETIDSYPSDDMFVLLGPSSTYALAMGRLPIRSVNDATIMVDKLISYENAPFDPWRNKITFVADDGKTSDGDDGSVYTDHSEGISETDILKSYEKNKIYEVTYPTVNSAGGRRKPDVNKAIIGAINLGAVITNYIGHGNDRLWAHEAVFTREDDLPQLINKDRLTFIMAATCSFGWYDNPTEESAGELLVTMEQGGAIAICTAARVVLDNFNYELNTDLFHYLFQRNSIGQFPRIGDAWLMAKAINSDQNNTLKFHLLGDPTVRLLLPQNTATIDSVNGFSMLTGDTIKIKSLSHVRIAGAVKQKSAADSSFLGEGILQLFDSQKQMSIIDGVGTFNFKLNGSLLYRGVVSVKNGQFADTVPIPKDVTFGNNTRIAIYTWNDKTDGTGNTENVMIDGIDNHIARDTIGPAISIYLDTTSFHPGDVVKSNTTIIVELEDESGINTSTVGVGHQLTATINNPERTFDLSSYYSSSLDNYKKGEVRYPLYNLSDGKYVLSVKAWDNQNNSSEQETFFEVHSADDFAMLNAVNYPNPFSNSTTFTFQRNSSDPIDVEVKIYSIAGRLIGTIKISNIAERFVRIPWNGKDNDGNTLANGIYFYKLIAHDRNAQRTNEVIGKLAVMR